LERLEFNWKGSQWTSEWISEALKNGYFAAAARLAHIFNIDPFESKTTSDFEKFWRRKALGKVLIVAIDGDYRTIHDVTISNLPELYQRFLECYLKLKDYIIGYALGAYLRSNFRGIQEFNFDEPTDEISVHAENFLFFGNYDLEAAKEKLSHYAINIR
jgi:hypothetical protein